MCAWVADSLTDRYNIIACMLGTLIALFAVRAYWYLHTYMVMRTQFYKLSLCLFFYIAAKRGLLGVSISGDAQTELNV